MKTKLLVFAMFWIGLMSFSQNTNVPDDNFENYLETHDASGNTVAVGDALSMGNGIANDNTVPTASIDIVITLDVGQLGISDLTGIEDFVSLTELLCDWNQLTSLDISKNTALTELNCYRNQLTSLDLSKNTALAELGCGDNELINLDISNNTALEVLHCSSSKLTSLDVSQNIALKELYCSHNELSSLDVSQNTVLEWINCDHNLLTSLNVNGTIALEFLNCQSNQLVSLDVSQNTALTTLYCDHNPLTTGLTVNGATALNSIYCDNTQLTSLDVSGATSLRVLYCDSNQLESLNVDGASALYWLYCQHNQLTSLDVSQNTVLDQLFCNDNQLTSLNMKNGNNVSMGLAFNAKTNPNLLCIDVDDADWSTANWSNYVDPQTSFSEDCATSLGVDDELLAKGLKLYPNPVSDILSVESKLALKKIEIYSILGQKVKEIHSNFNSISTSHLSTGIFLIKIYSEKGIVFRKLIKQ